MHKVLEKLTSFGTSILISRPTNISSSICLLKSQSYISYQDAIVIMDDLKGIVYQIKDDDKLFEDLKKEIISTNPNNLSFKNFTKDNFTGFVWLLEHEQVFTIGSSGNPEIDLLNKKTKIPTIQTNRGGKITYHGPGQAVVYFILDVKKLQNKTIPDVKGYVRFLEQIVIDTLKSIGIEGFRVDGKVGIWVNHDSKYEKIAAIGVRISKGIATHGFAINVNLDLNVFKSIVPCGISDFGVCSIESLGLQTTTEQVFDLILNSLS